MTAAVLRSVFWAHVRGKISLGEILLPLPLPSVAAKGCHLSLTLPVQLCLTLIQRSASARQQMFDGLFGLVRFMSSGYFRRLLSSCHVHFPASSSPYLKRFHITDDGIACKTMVCDHIKQFLLLRHRFQSKNYLAVISIWKPFLQFVKPVTFQKTLGLDILDTTPHPLAEASRCTRMYVETCRQLQWKAYCFSRLAVPNSKYISVRVLLYASTPLLLQ